MGPRQIQNWNRKPICISRPERGTRTLPKSGPGAPLVKKLLINFGFAWLVRLKNSTRAESVYLFANRSFFKARRSRFTDAGPRNWFRLVVGGRVEVMPSPS